MQILTAPHPMLRTICRADFSISFEQVAEMFRLLRQRDALGLAAPQVGIAARFFVTEWREMFINPEIVERAPETVLMEEGCLSIPGQWFMVQRYPWIRLRSGAIYQGVRAQVIQHECDHLNGILISDIGVEAA